METGAYLVSLEQEVHRVPEDLRDPLECQDLLERQAGTVPTVHLEQGAEMVSPDRMD